MNNMRNIFGVSQFSYEGNQLNVYLRSAISEIKAGSPDSFELAKRILNLRRIENAPLESLIHLYNTVPKHERDEQFHQSCVKLQLQAIEEINQLLQ